MDHFSGFFLGRMILVCLGSGTVTDDGGVAESFEMGVDTAFTEI